MLLKTLTDMIEGASAESSEEFLCAEVTQITDGIGPQVQNIIPGERASFFKYNNLSAQQCQLNSSPKTTGASTQHQTLTHTERD